MRRVARRRFSIVVPIPSYARPRNEWRRRVHSAVLEAQTRRGVGYRDADRLEVRLSLDLGDRALEIDEIDERLSDVLDALAGRIAGPRSRRRIAPIVPSADQIRRVIVEKSAGRRRRGMLGTLAISRHHARRA